MRGYRIELRHSPALVAIPLLLFLHALAVFRRMPHGVDVWAETCAGIVMSVILAGPVSAGVAAWAGTREARRRTGYLRHLGTRPVWAPLAELLALMTAGALAYLVVAAVALVKTGPGATWGHPEILWLVAGVAGLGLHVCVGYIAGRLVRRAWVAPVVAVATYLIAALNLTAFGEWWYFLSGVTAQQVDVFRRLNQTLFLGQLIWYAGLTAVVFLGWLVWEASERRRFVPALVASAVVAALGAGLVVGQGSRFFDGPAAFEYRCAGGPVQVCVHPAYQRSLAALTREFDALAAKVEGTPLFVARVEQHVRGADGLPVRPEVGRFALDDLSPGYARRAVGEFVDSRIGVWSACRGAPDNVQLTFLSATSVVRAWLVDDESEPLSDDARSKRAHDWFARLSEPQRQDWLRAHYSRIRTCSLGWADFS